MRDEKTRLFITLSHRPSPLVPRPSSFVPRPSSFVPRPSSLVPRLSSLVFRPSSLVPRLSSLVLRPCPLVSDAPHFCHTCAAKVWREPHLLQHFRFSGRNSVESPAVHGQKSSPGLGTVRANIATIHDVIPPSAGFKRPNRPIDFSYLQHELPCHYRFNFKRRRKGQWGYQRKS